jgi:hypothetical protein
MCWPRWAESSPKPLVLLIDEIDALIGDTLIAVLRLDHGLHGLWGAGQRDHLL